MADHVCKYIEELAELMVRMETVRDSLQRGEARFHEVEDNIRGSFDRLTGSMRSLEEDVMELQRYQQKVNTVIQFFVWLFGFGGSVLTIPWESWLQWLAKK